MSNKIYFKASVKRDLKAIDKTRQLRILEELMADLSANADAGKVLKNSDFLSLRIENYRVIYQKVSDGLLIVRIAHRKEVYRN